MSTAVIIKTLRERSGAGILDCKKALNESGGDLESAMDWLRAKGIASAAKKSGRIASEGLVGSYIHANGKIGVLLEVNCETDFVALNDGFQDLVRDLAMHIAASAPEYVSRDEVPSDISDFVHRLMQPQPTKRYDSYEALLAAIEALQKAP